MDTMSDTAARRARTDPSAELCGLLAALRLAPREPELFALVFGAADANSLGRIAQTCRLAAAKSIARDGGELSPVEEAARLQVLRRCPSASASALPVQFADSWLRTLWCLERRLVFDRVPPQLSAPTEGGSVTFSFAGETYYTPPDTNIYYTAAAASSARSGNAGKQYVEFTVLEAPSNMLADLAETTGGNPCRGTSCR
jgi:hypothetical protein